MDTVDTSARMEPVELCPVTALLHRGGILYGVPGTDKTSAITGAIERMALPAGVNRDLVVEQILRRESLASTAAGEGIAIPHPQNAPALHLTESVLSLALLSQPVDFDAPDGKPVQALFILLSHNAAQHLRLLAHLGRMLLNPEVLRAISGQVTADEIEAVCSRAEVAASSRKPAPAP